MFTIHIISDLDYGDTEHTEIAEENIPDVDLIICNGNLGLLKRSLNFATKLAQKRPDTQVVWNPGDMELFKYIFPKYEGEIRDSFITSTIAADWWNKNLHYAYDSLILNLRNGEQVDVLPLLGWPYIHSYEGLWEDTWFFKNVVIDSISNVDDPDFLKYKPHNTSMTNHFYPRWATQDYVNKKHQEEHLKAKDWELSNTSYKILLTHFNPYKDSRFYNLQVSPYRIHLDNMLWITSNTKCENVKFLGARLVSNPGRGEIARSHIVTINP